MRRFSIEVRSIRGEILTVYYGELPIELPEMFQVKLEFMEGEEL